MEYNRLCFPSNITMTNPRRTWQMYTGFVRNCVNINTNLRLTRQKLRLATGTITRDSQLNQHLSDPTCNYCEEGLETAAHFLYECSHFVTQRQEIWGKSYLHPSEADSVQNVVRFILKSHRFS